ncbi:hypothetical protein AcW1_001036 [Taiwanofungus camphoratus]|nr:hypothetical protein AcW1_001036 [Antrodia cinnamomea]
MKIAHHIVSGLVSGATECSHIAIIHAQVVCIQFTRIQVYHSYIAGVGVLPRRRHLLSASGTPFKGNYYVLLRTPCPSCSVRTLDVVSDGRPLEYQYLNLLSARSEC